jgi:UDPglucose 6-dehydrogenase
MARAGETGLKTTRSKTARQTIRSQRPTISIFGLGYVGLTTAACFASKGIGVLGIDIDRSRINEIESGEIPFYEPGLEGLLSRARGSGKLQFTVDYNLAISQTKISFVSVGTPSLPDGTIDLRYIEEVSRRIGKAMRAKSGWHLVVVRSTSLPGTCGNLVKPIIEKLSGKKCGYGWGLCSNPEFLKEGSAIHDAMNPDRVVIGKADNRSGRMLSLLYRKLCPDAPIVATTWSNAELIKYASNAFLATKISFINTIARICQSIPGADVVTVAKGMGMDYRIGYSFLNAGIGYGGSCFPKDLAALVAGYRTNEIPLLESVQFTNDCQPSQAVELARESLGSLKGRRIAILGLAFKPGTDDMREAVSLKVIRQLLNAGASVVVHDPRAISAAKSILGESVSYASSPADCINMADCCIIVTEWNEYKSLRPDDFKTLMRTPVVIDGRRIFDSGQFARATRFAAIGLGPALEG